MANTPLPCCTTGTHHDTVPGGATGASPMSKIPVPCLMHMRCRWEENRGNLREAETRNPAMR